MVIEGESQVGSQEGSQRCQRAYGVLRVAWVSKEGYATHIHAHLHARTHACTYTAHGCVRMHLCTCTGFAFVLYNTDEAAAMALENWNGAKTRTGWIMTGALPYLAVGRERSPMHEPRPGLEFRKVTCTDIHFTLGCLCVPPLAWSSPPPLCTTGRPQPAPMPVLLSIPCPISGPPHNLPTPPLLLAQCGRLIRANSTCAKARASDRNGPKRGCGDGNGCSWDGD